MKRDAIPNSTNFFDTNVARQVVGRCTHFWLAQLVWADFFLVAAWLKKSRGCVN